MPRVLLQEIEREVLRFLTPITWAKLGMFSAVGALCGSQLFLQDSRLSNVASVLSTHEAWSDIRRGTISALGRWRRRHTFLPNPAISWKVAFDFFGTQLALHIQKSCPKLVIVVLNVFLVSCINGLLMQNSIVERLTWNIGCKPKDGMVTHLRRTLRHLPRSVPQPHRWFLFKVHLNAPTASARLVAARVVEEPIQCCFCSSSSDSLDHLPRCFTVLDVYNSISDTANLPPIIDGRHTASCCKNHGREAC